MYTLSMPHDKISQRIANFTEYLKTSHLALSFSSDSINLHAGTTLNYTCKKIGGRTITVVNDQTSHQDIAHTTSDVAKSTTRQHGDNINQ